MRLLVQKSGSDGNSYILENSSEALILDCGVNLKQTTRSLSYDISKIVGCIVTHEHLDHARYADEYELHGFKVFKPYLGGKQSIKLGGFQIHAFSVPHDGVECRGFLIEHEDLGKLLYMTDLEYCGYTFQSQKVSHMLVEANYSQKYISDGAAKKAHVLKGHAEIGVALGIIKTNKTEALQNVILCHLSRESASPLEFVAQAQEVAGDGVYVDYARSGLEIELAKTDRR